MWTDKPPYVVHYTKEEDFCEWVKDVRRFTYLENM